MEIEWRFPAAGENSRRAGNPGYVTLDLLYRVMPIVHRPLVRFAAWLPAFWLLCAGPLAAQNGLSGEPPRERQAEKDEKAEQKAQRDKDFAETRKRLESRVAREKGLAHWTFVVDAKQIAPLLKTREQMVAQRKPDAENGQNQSAGPKAKASKGKR